MPTYDYRCEANAQTIEATHPMSRVISTWGELCECTGTDPGDTPVGARVEKVIPLVAARSRSGTAPARPGGPCGSGCGCHPG